MTREQRDGRTPAIHRFLRLPRSPQCAYDPRSPPTLQPLDLTLLAVDVAARAGFAIYHRGRLAQFGECDTRTPDHRAAVLTLAQDFADREHVPLALALEIPFGGTLRTTVSLSGSVDLWRDSWRARGLPLRHALELYATDWRAAVLGSHKLPRLQARRLERLTAERIVAELGRTLVLPIGPDAAAAVCMGYFARRSAQLQRATGCALVTRA